MGGCAVPHRISSQNEEINADVNEEIKCEFVLRNETFVEQNGVIRSGPTMHLRQLTGELQTTQFKIKFESIF